MFGVATGSSVERVSKSKMQFRRKREVEHGSGGYLLLAKHL